MNSPENDTGTFGGISSTQALQPGSSNSLDMNSVDFMSEALVMDPQAVISQILTSDQLVCSSEDQVVDFVKEYLKENGMVAQGYAAHMLALIRYDYVSTAKLIDLQFD